jgi:hypothetical protein
MKHIRSSVVAVTNYNIKMGTNSFDFGATLLTQQRPIFCPGLPPWTSGKLQFLGHRNRYIHNGEMLYNMDSGLMQQGALNPTFVPVPFEAVYIQCGIPVIISGDGRKMNAMCHLGCILVK